MYFSPTDGNLNIVDDIMENSSDYGSNPTVSRIWKGIFEIYAKNVFVKIENLTSKKRTNATNFFCKAFNVVDQVDNGC